MPLNFPNNPTDGQTYAVANLVYYFRSASNTWTGAGLITAANTANVYVLALANDYSTYISATSSANAQTSANSTLYFTFVTGLDQITTVRSNTKLSYDASNSILNMSDAQLARPALKDYALVRVDLGNVTGSTTINLEQGNFFTATSTGATTWTFSNPPTGSTAGGFVLELTNGGSQTQNWPTGTKWPGGNAPVLTSVGVDVLVFMSDDAGTTWRGVASMLDSK